MIRFRKTQKINLPILVIPLDRLPETCADCPCARIVSDVEEGGVDYCTAEFRELMPSCKIPEWCPAYPGVIETDQSFFNQDNLQKFNEGTNGRKSKKENAIGAFGAICLAVICAQIMYGLGAVSGDSSKNARQTMNAISHFLREEQK